jgi:hypothetical protein
VGPGTAEKACQGKQDKRATLHAPVMVRGQNYECFGRSGIVDPVSCSQ